MNSFKTAIFLSALFLSQNDVAVASSANRLRTRPIYISGNNKAATGTVSNRHDAEPQDSFAFGEERELFGEVPELGRQLELEVSMSMSMSVSMTMDISTPPKTPEEDTEDAEGGASATDFSTDPESSSPPDPLVAVSSVSSAAAVGSTLCALVVTTGAVLML